jgi:pimeloyl-ACP methyl ester carboxylesterase
MIPTAIFGLWLSGLLAVALLVGGAGLAREWYRRSWAFDVDRHAWAFAPNLGWNAETGFLAAGLALLIVALFGGLLLRLAMRLLGRAGHPAGAEAWSPEPPPEESRRLVRPDGSELHVTLCGPEGAPALILTHGWGANGSEWNDLKRRLAGRFRIVAWDLPGLGQSKRPDSRDYSLENLARHLHAVLDLVPGRPAVLVGHSIGGMITLTFCRLFPEALGPRVAGLVLVHTTYTNPVRTTKGAAFYSAIERPVIVPLLHLAIGLSPVLWIMSWLSYLNGSAHLSTRRSGFAGTQTPEQVEFTARFQPHASPAVLARGMFGMLEYDATTTLERIPVPALVVAGDRDPVCLPEASERIRQGIPAAELSALRPAKHMGLIEHHGHFADLVAAFAAAHTGEAPRGASASVTIDRASLRGHDAGLNRP